MLFVQAVGLVVCLSVRMANFSGSRRTYYSGVSDIFLLLTLFCTFSSLFTQWLIYPFSFHIDNCHINFYFPFSQFMCRCKDWNACHNSWSFCTVLLREITQNKTDMNISNFSVLLLFLEKVPGKGAFFVFFHLTIVYQGFYIWNLKRKYTIISKILLRKRYFCPYDTMVKIPCSVISESVKISKSLLVTISKVTMKLHNVKFYCSISNLKEIYPKTEWLGSALNFARRNCVRTWHISEKCIYWPKRKLIF